MAWGHLGKLPGGDKTCGRECTTVECFCGCQCCGRASDQEPGDSSLVLVFAAISCRFLPLSGPQLCLTCTETLAIVISNRQSNYSVLGLRTKNAWREPGAREREAFSLSLRKSQGSKVPYVLVPRGRKWRSPRVSQLEGQKGWRGVPRSVAC